MNDNGGEEFGSFPSYLTFIPFGLYIMTNQIKHYLLIIAALLLVAACQEKLRQEQVTVEDTLPVFKFDNADSTEVQRLAGEFLTLINNHDFATAATMLRSVHNNSIFDLTDVQRQGFLSAMTTFASYGAELREIEMLSDRDNRIRFAIKMVEDGDFETGRGTTNFYLNPVLQDGKWYLTIMDQYAEGVGLYHDNEQ